MSTISAPLGELSIKGPSGMTVAFETTWLDEDGQPLDISAGVSAWLDLAKKVDDLDDFTDATEYAALDITENVATFAVPVSSSVDGCVRLTVGGVPYTIGRVWRQTRGGSIDNDQTIVVRDGGSVTVNTLGVVHVDGPGGSGLPAGGTTGQALRKVSDDHGDADWDTLTAIDVGADPAGTAAGLVAAEATTRGDADVALLGAITAEAASRAAGDLALDGRLDTAEATLAAAPGTYATLASLATEVTNRGNGDTAAVATAASDATTKANAAQAAAIAAAATDATTKANAAQAAAISAAATDATSKVGVETTARVADVDAEETRALAAEALLVAKSLYDANTVLAATADNTPLPITMAASTILARLASGDIVAATPSQLRTLLALVIGTDVQAFHANLTALAGLTLVADRLPYANGSGTLALATFTSAGRSMVAAADAAAQALLLGSEVFKQAQATNAQTGTTYTLVAGDAGKLVTLSNASAITLTLPQDSDATIAVGTYVDLYQLGAGQVTVAAGTGATLRTSGLTAKARAQYSRLGVQKVSANTWSLFGDLAAS